MAKTHLPAQNKSESLIVLATMLSRAQSNNDRFAESILMPQIDKLFRTKSRLDTRGTVIERFFSSVCFGLSDCWYWTASLDPLGYGCVGKVASNFYEHKAHRLSYRLFHGDIPDGLKVCHKCDVRSCVNPDHLFLGTQKDNVTDMIQKGRMRHGPPLFGTKNPGSKLTDDEVRAMRELHADGNHSYNLIGRIFGIATMNAHRIINRKQWTHIQ